MRLYLFIVAVFILLQSYTNRILNPIFNCLLSKTYPVDTGLIHQKLTLHCGDTIVSAERTANKLGENPKKLIAVGWENGFKKYILESNPGEKYVLDFQNGNIVSVNSASSVTFNPRANFYDITKGESCFDIQQNSKILISEKLVIWALKGAEMNVKRYCDYPFEQVEICLTRGQAMAQMLQNSRILIAGEMIIFKNDSLSEGIPIDTNDVVSWKKETFQYHSVSFDKLAAIIARWYNKQLIFVAKIPRFNVSFDALFSDPLDEIIKKLNAKKKRVHCYVEDDKLFVAVK